MARMNGEGNLIEHLSIMERCKRLLEKTEAKISDTEMVLRIMDSLPSSWDSFCQGIQSQKEITKSYTNFKAALLEEADYRKMSKSSHPRTQQTALNAAKSKITCHNYKKPGHKKAECWANLQRKGPRRNSTATTQRSC